MGTSSLNEYGCTSPIIKHLHLQNEIPRILLYQSTSFLKMAEGSQDAPMELGPVLELSSTGAFQNGQLRGGDPGQEA